jgi:hypothetical protein
LAGVGYSTGEIEDLLNNGACHDDT